MAKKDGGRTASRGRDPVPGADAARRTRLQQAEKVRRELDMREEVSRSYAGQQGANRLPQRGRSSFTLWESLLFLLQSLFTGISLEVFIRNQDLKRIRHLVDRYRPHLYSARLNRLNGYFARMVYALSSRVTGFEQVFNTCVAARPDDEDSGPGPFLLYFVEQYVQDLPDLQECFNYSRVVNEKEQFDESHLQATVEKEVDSFLDRIPPDRATEINYLYGNLMSFARLADFDFLPLFKAFSGKGLLEDDASSFTPVSGTLVLRDLLRLEEQLYSLDLSVDVFRPFEILLAFYSERFQRNGDEMEAVLPWQRSDIEKLLDSILSFLHEERLTNIIRLIAADPYHLPTVAGEKSDLLKELRAFLVNKYVPHCRMIVDRIVSEQLTRSIQQLFGTRPLAGIQFYNEVTDKRLRYLGLPSFTNYLHLQLIRTYAEETFFAVVKPALNVVVVDGVFSDKALYKGLSDFFYNFENSLKSIDAFEKQTSSSSKEGAKLQSMFNSYDMSASARKVLSDKVHYLNHLSAKIIREITHLFKGAVPAFNQLVKDARASGKPQFVQNVRSLGGMRNSRLIKSLEEAADKTARVHAILEPFLQQGKDG